MRRQASHTVSGAETLQATCCSGISARGSHSEHRFPAPFSKEARSCLGFDSGFDVTARSVQSVPAHSGRGPAPRLVLILGLPQLATTAARPESTGKRKPESTARAATEHTVVRAGLLHADSVVFRVLSDRIRPFRQPESESSWRHSTSS